MLFQLIGLLLLAFKIWMLVDSIQRSGFESSFNYWFFICWVPGGEWFYFFLVKAHDPEIAKYWKRLLRRGASLSQLRYAAKNSPSIVNQMALARGLCDAGEFAEAKSITTEILKQRDNDREVLFLFAASEMGLGQFDAAADALQKIVATDFSWNNFTAATMLASALSQSGKKSEALDLLRRVSKKSGQLVHAVELGKLLLESGSTIEARDILQQGLEDYRHSPRFIKKQNRHYAKQAASLLGTL